MYKVKHKCFIEILFTNCRLCKATRKISARTSGSDSRIPSEEEDLKRTLIRKEATPEMVEGRGTRHVTMTTMGLEVATTT